MVRSILFLRSCLSYLAFVIFFIHLPCRAFADGEGQAMAELLYAYQYYYCPGAEILPTSQPPVWTKEELAQHLAELPSGSSEKDIADIVCYEKKQPSPQSSITLARGEFQKRAAVSSKDGDRLVLASTGGLKILSIGKQDSLMQYLGLNRGDIILTVDGTKLTGINFVDLFIEGSLLKKTNFVITINRGGSIFKISYMVH